MMFDHSVIRYTTRYLSFENDLLIKDKPQLLVSYSSVVGNVVSIYVFL